MRVRVCGTIQTRIFSLYFLCYSWDTSVVELSISNIWVRVVASNSVACSAKITYATVQHVV